MPSKLIDPAELPTMTFDWGVIKPLVTEHNVSEWRHGGYQDWLRDRETRAREPASPSLW